MQVSTVSWRRPLKGMEKALVGAFSVIVKTDGSFASLFVIMALGTDPGCREAGIL